MRRPLSTSLAALAILAGCGGGAGPVPDHHDHEGAATSPETVGVARSALVATDPVSTAATDSCTTTAVLGLSVQLVEEIQCLRPGTLTGIDNVPGIALASSVFPYLQVPAADALVRAQKARGTTMNVNSALRTLAQQYLLFRWYKLGRCGIGLAASPGTSNHESGLAVDIADNAGWHDAMTKSELRWLGASDPVHFDYIGAGRVELRGLSVLAFQRLWNRNHPDDRIAEDGAYGPVTEEHLARSPVGGFDKGADCTQQVPPVDAGPPGEVPVVPDGPEASAPEQEDGGCAMGRRAPSSLGVFLGLLVFVVIRAARRARARQARARGCGARSDRRSLRH